MAASEPLEQWIRDKANTGAWWLTRHAQRERLAEAISTEDIEQALTTAEIVESYPEDPRGASCLVLGRSAKGPLHLVVGGFRSRALVVITVYRPSAELWESDLRTRRRSGSRD